MRQKLKREKRNGLFMKEAALFSKGKTLYIDKRYKSALKVFSLIDVKNIGNYEESIVHHYRALCFARLVKLRPSMEEFELAIRFRPNDTKIYLDMGKTLYFFYEKNVVRDFLLSLFGKKNLLQKAVKCFERGLLAEPQESDLWYYRGYMMELLGREGDAKKSYKKCKKRENYENSTLFESIKTSTMSK